MTDDLRHLAPLLGVPTAALRRAIGPGWVRKGDESIGFNITHSPVFIDRPRKPRVMLQVTTVYYCTPLDDGSFGSTRDLTIATPSTWPEPRGFRWQASQPMGSLSVSRGPDEGDDWLLRLSRLIDDVRAGRQPAATRSLTTG